MTPSAIAITGALLSALFLTSLGMAREPVRLSRASRAFIVLFFALFALQLLPLGPLFFPETQALRDAHGIQGIWPGTADTFHTLRVFVQLSSYLLAGILALNLRQLGLQLGSMMPGLMILLAAEAVYSFVQTFIPLDSIPFFGPRQTMVAASGTLVNSNTFAALMGIGLVLATGLALKHFRATGRRTSSATARSAENLAEGRSAAWLKGGLEGGLLWVLVVGVFLAAMLLAKSRGAMISALSALFVLLMLHRGRTNPFGTLVLFAFGAACVMFARPEELLARFETLDPFDVARNERVQFWIASLKGVLAQPWLGFGMGTYRQAFHPFQPLDIVGQQLNHPHNELLNILFEGGIFAVLLAASALVFWFVRAHRGLRSLAPHLRVPVSASIAGVFLIVVHSIVDLDFQITSIGILFFILLAFGAASDRLEEPVSKIACGVGGLATFAGSVALAFLPIDPTAVADQAIKEAGEAREREPGEARERRESLLRRTLALSPYDYRAAAFFGQTAVMGGDKDLADERLDRAGDLWPAHGVFQEQIGVYFFERYLETHDRDQLLRSARFLGRRFEQSPRTVGSVFDAIGSSTVPLLDLALLVPEQAIPTSHFAAFLVKEGHWEEAMRVFERVCSKEPLVAEAFDVLASALETAGQWGLEAKVRDQRLRAKSHAWAYAAAARAWERLEITSEALARATTAAKIEPWNSEWHLLLGELYAREGDAVHAIDELTEAVRLAPREIAPRMARAKVYERQKLWTSAKEDFEEIWNRRKDHGDAARGLVRVLEALNDRSAAQDVLRKYVAERPDDEEAKKLESAMAARPSG